MGRKNTKVLYPDRCDCNMEPQSKVLTRKKRDIIKKIIFKLWGKRGYPDKRKKFSAITYIGWNRDNNKYLRLLNVNTPEYC